MFASRVGNFSLLCGPSIIKGSILIVFRDGKCCWTMWHEVSSVLQPRLALNHLIACVSAANGEKDATALLGETSMLHLGSSNQGGDSYDSQMSPCARAKQHSVALGSQKSRQFSILYCAFWKNIVTFIFQKSQQESGHLCHNVQGVWYAISIGMYHGGAAAWVEPWYSNVLFSKRYRMNAGWIFVHIGCHTCLILQVAGWGFGIKCQSFGLKPKIEICCQQLR